LHGRGGGLPPRQNGREGDSIAGLVRDEEVGVRAGLENVCREIPRVQKLMKIIINPSNNPTNLGTTINILHKPDLVRPGRGSEEKNKWERRC
jgi:hypothetical protein